MTNNEAANRFEDNSSENSFVVPPESLLGEARQQVGAGSSDAFSDSSSDAQQSQQSQSEVSFVEIPNGETNSDSGNDHFGSIISTEIAVDPAVTVLYPGDEVPLTRSEGAMEREAALARLAEHPDIAKQLEQERIGEGTNVRLCDNPQSTQHIDGSEESENGVGDENSVVRLEWNELSASRQIELHSSRVYQNADLIRLPPREAGNTSRRKVHFADDLPHANNRENPQNDGVNAKEIHRAPSPYPSQQSAEIPYTSDLLHPSPPLLSRHNAHHRYSITSEIGTYSINMSDTVSTSSTVRPAEDAGQQAVPDIKTTELSQVRDPELRTNLVKVICNSAAALSEKRGLPFMIKVDGRLYAQVFPNQLHRLSELEGGLDTFREMLNRSEHASVGTSLTEETVQNCKAYVEAQLEKAKSTASNKVSEAHEDAMQARRASQACEKKLDKAKQEETKLHEFEAKIKENFAEELSSLTPFKPDSEDHPGDGGTPPNGGAPHNGPLGSSEIIINVTDVEQGASSTYKGSTTSPHNSHVSSENEKAHRLLGIGGFESSARLNISQVKINKVATSSDKAKDKDGNEAKATESKVNVAATIAKDNAEVASPQSKGRFTNENFYGRDNATEDKSATFPSNSQARSSGNEHKHVKMLPSGRVEGAGPIPTSIDASEIGLAFSTPDELDSPITERGSINSSNYSGDETSVQKATAESIKFQKARLVDVPARRGQVPSTSKYHGNIGLATTPSASLAVSGPEKDNKYTADVGHSVLPSVMTGSPTAAGSAISSEGRIDSFVTKGKMNFGKALKANQKPKDHAISGGTTNTRRNADPFAKGDMMDMMEFLKAKKNAENAEYAAQFGRVPTTGRITDPSAGMGMTEKMEAKKAAKISEDLAAQGIAKKPVKKPQGFSDYNFTGPVTQNTPLFSNAPSENEKAFARGLTEKNKLAKAKSMEGFGLQKGDGARSIGESPVKAMAKSIGASIKGMGRSKGEPAALSTHVEQEDC